MKVMGFIRHGMKVPCELVFNGQHCFIDILRGTSPMTCKYLVIKTYSGVCQSIFYFLILGGFLSQSKSRTEFLNFFAI